MICFSHAYSLSCLIALRLDKGFLDTLGSLYFQIGDKAVTITAPLCRAIAYNLMILEEVTNQFFPV